MNSLSIIQGKKGHPINLESGIFRKTHPTKNHGTSTADKKIQVYLYKSNFGGETLNINFMFLKLFS